MGKSWKDRSRKDKWDRGDNKSRKSKRGTDLPLKKNKWQNYEEYGE